MGKGCSFQETNQFPPHLPYFCACGEEGGGGGGWGFCVFVVCVSVVDFY